MKRKTMKKGVLWWCCYWRLSSKHLLTLEGIRPHLTPSTYTSSFTQPIAKLTILPMPYCILCFTHFYKLWRIKRHFSDDYGTEEKKSTCYIRPNIPANLKDARICNWYDAFIWIGLFDWYLFSSINLSFLPCLNCPVSKVYLRSGGWFCALSFLPKL